MRNKQAPSEIALRFKQRLKAARKSSGLTQDGLAAAAGLSPVTLSKLETGVNLPTFEIFVALSKALGVRPDYLAGWDAIDPSAGDERRRLLLEELSLAAANLPERWISQLIAVANEASSKDADEDL